MKNVINNSKKVFLMVALAATVMGYANDKSFFYLKNEANKTVLTLTQVKAGNLVSIKDENGIVLYKELIQQAGIYKKGFDFSNLTDGKYFLELNKDVEIDIVPFSVKGKEISFEDEKTETIFKPVTVLKEDKVFITKLSLEKEALDIKVYYDSSDTNQYELIHSESIKGTKNIERILKISDFEKGNYKIVYRTEGRLFVEYI